MRCTLDIATVCRIPKKLFIVPPHTQATVHDLSIGQESVRYQEETRLPLLPSNVNGLHSRKVSWDLGSRILANLEWRRGFSGDLLARGA